MIFVKTWLERVSNVSIGYYSVGGVSRFLKELIFFQICFICNFAVAMEVGRCFIRSTVRLDHVEK